MAGRPAKNDAGDVGAIPVDGAGAGCPPKSGKLGGAELAMDCGDRSADGCGLAAPLLPSNLFTQNREN